MEVIKLVKGFEAVEDGEKIAQIEFTIHDGVMRITHTEVKEKARGKGLATELVNTAVRYARHKNLKVKPLCSIADFVMKNGDFKDVLE